MPYSQKYAIAQFFQAAEVGQEFSMSEWPLHITLADVFAITVTEQLTNELQGFIDNHDSVTTRAIEERALGATPVVVLENTPALQTYHNDLVDILLRHGAVFNVPEYTRSGFLPHITHQPYARMQVGDEVVIGSISLVDMFPDGDWQMRKIHSIFAPKQTKL
jgi:hypothetical protein